MELDLAEAIKSWISTTPLLLVLGVAFLVAVVRWDRHPSVSALTCLGAGALFLLMLASPFLWARIHRLIMDLGGEFENTIRIASFVQSLMFAACHAILLLAIFADRSPRSSSMPDDRPGWD